jgi:hypothetical protein
MANPPNVFRVLSEFIVMLLGALMIMVAVSGHMGFPASPEALVVMGVILIYWGGRTWIRKSPGDRLQERIRGASLVLAGLAVLGMRYLPVRHEELLLALAGGVLVFRGLLISMLFVRQSTVR